MSEIAGSLSAWESFYVIVGSSAGALTGLQFVVMTLINESETTGTEAISAFGTPNVVHFCACLLVSCILSIPWNALHPAGLGVAACGLLGVAYCVLIMRRALRQKQYEPVLEDWLWHVIIPAIAYGTLLVAGWALAATRADALFYIGPAALLLVFTGIHNAWDTVMFLAARRAAAERRPRPDSAHADAPASRNDA